MSIVKHLHYLKLCIVRNDRVDFNLVDVHRLTKCDGDSGAACPRHEVVRVGSSQCVVKQVMKPVVAGAVAIRTVTPGDLTAAVIDILVA